MKRNGIERQTMLVAIIPIMLMIVLLESYSVYMRFDDLNKALLERSESMLRQLAYSSEYAVFSGNADLLRSYVDTAFTERSVNRIVIYDTGANVLMASEAKNGVSAPAPASLDAAHRIYQDGNSLWLYEPIVPTQVKLDELSYDVSSRNAPGKPLGWVVMEVSKRHLNHQKNNILVRNFLMIILVYAASFFAALRIARKITRPILEMNDAIHRIGEGRLDTYIHPLAIAELEQLAQGVNKMASQLHQDRVSLEQKIAEATEELRHQKDAAEDASQDKSRFLAAASHDLRQPMHALGLFIDELRDKVKTPEQLQIVALIEQSTAAMSSMLSSLLDISKLDAGAVKPKMAIFPIQFVLNRMMQDYVPVATRKGITLHIRPADDYVESDSVLLERILLNLVNNAISYTPQDGRVLVACRKRRDYLRIEVRDNGPGIPVESQKNIFREFFQLDNVVRHREKGLGLGLAIVDRLSRLLKHPFSLRSAPGKGSVFAIDVPVVNLAIEDRHSAGQLLLPVSGRSFRESSARLENVRVMVVDDDPLVLAGTRGILESWGGTVDVAESVEEARDLISKTEFNLLICDYGLGDGNGLDVIKWAERTYRRHVPAILVSGDTSAEVLKKVAAEGRHLLHKPVRPAKLRSLIIFLLAGNR
ncbi:MAG: response regulator [Sideroxydans sp.]|nr:response regulator [Sideroxydans sp.]